MIVMLINGTYRGHFYLHFLGFQVMDVPERGCFLIVFSLDLPPQVTKYEVFVPKLNKVVLVHLT